MNWCTSCKKFKEKRCTDTTKTPCDGTEKNHAKYKLDQSKKELLHEEREKDLKKHQPKGSEDENTGRDNDKGKKNP